MWVKAVDPTPKGSGALLVRLYKDAGAPYICCETHLYMILHSDSFIHNQKGSGSPLVRLYKDAGSPSNECSLSEF